MANDPRYGAVKVLIEEGYVSYFRDIFQHLPKSVLGFSMGINNTRITRLIHHPDQFTINELNRIAALFDIEPAKIIKLVYAQLQIQQNNLTKNKGNKKTNI
jgi:plasmid maintenance system antidote protein VapI